MSTAPLVELRPRANRFWPDTLRRFRSGRGVGALLAAALAGLGGAVAYGHNLSPLIIVGITVAVTGVLVVIVYGWFAVAVLGTRWTLYPDRLVVRRPGAKELHIPLKDLSTVRLESVSGFGMQDPIYVFLDADSNVLFWSVASRWSDVDLRQLWKRLDLEPVNALNKVNEFQAMPYDRRY